MANPLKAAYKANASGAANAPPVSTGQTSTAPSTEVSSTGGLAALRAKLAGNGLGGVNPPEKSLADDALTRKTQETADGGAEEIPVAATATPETPTEKTKRTRRTKAEMEAERASQSATSTAEQPAEGFASFSGELSLSAAVAAVRHYLPPGTSITIEAQ